MTKAFGKSDQICAAVRLGGKEVTYDACTWKNQHGKPRCDITPGFFYSNARVSSAHSIIEV